MLDTGATRSDEVTGRVAIVGAALSDCGRVDTKSPFELHYQGAKRALDDAGLTKDDVDGLGSNGMGLLAPVEIAEYLGLRPTWIDGTGVGGATWVVMAEHAVEAILAGHAEMIVLVYGSTTRADLKSQRRRANLAFGTRGPIQFDAPYGHALIAKYAMATRRHMYEYGTTIEQLAEIAVSTRYNAGLNPDAYYRDPITIDDVQSSPMIADPLTKLHCCIRSDGGGAIVLTSEERAQDLKRPPVWVLGSGETSSHTTMSEWEDFTESPADPLREARLRTGRHHPRRCRHLPDLRRLHVDGAAVARGARVLRQGRRWPVRGGRQAAGRRRATDEHRRRRSQRVPPGHARDVPDGRSGEAAPQGGRRPSGPGRTRIACVNGTGGWFSSAATLLLGLD